MYYGKKDQNKTLLEAIKSRKPPKVSTIYANPVQKGITLNIIIELSTEIATQK